MCKKIESIKKTLKEFDVMLDDILESITISVDGEPERKITDSDKLQMIISEWYETSSKLYDLKIDVNEG